MQFIREGGGKCSDLATSYDAIGYIRNPSREQLLELYRHSPLAKSICYRYAEKVYSDGFNFTDASGEPVPFMSEIKLSNANLKFAAASGYARAVGVAYIVVSFESETDMSSEIKYKKGDSIDFMVMYRELKEKSESRGAYLFRGENSKKEEAIHWTRVIELDARIAGDSVLFPVFNHVLKVEMSSGATANAFVLNQRADLLVSIDPNVDATPEDTRGFIDKVRSKIGLAKERLVIAAAGVTSKVIEYPTASPLDSNKAIYQLISHWSKIPLRILTGEGGGVTVGSEDVAAYNATIMEEKDTFGVVALSQLHDILRHSGVLTVDCSIAFNPQISATASQVNDDENTIADTHQKRAAVIATLKAAGISIDHEEFLKTGEIKGGTSE